jgi:hypothetical protein
VKPEELIVCDPILRQGGQNGTMTFVERDHAYRREKLRSQRPDFERRSMKGVCDVRDDSRRQKDSVESGLSRNHSTLRVAVEYI